MEKKNNIEKNITAKKRIWSFPWGYAEGFLISLTLLVLGISLEIVSKGKGVTLLKFPSNAIVGITFITILLFLQIVMRKNKIIRWLSTIPAAISSLSLLTILVLLMGFIPQNDKTSDILRLMGLTHLNSSYLFVLAEIYFLTTLGLVSIRRATPFNKKNIGFLMNHTGLWIVLFAGTIGSGDMMRFSMHTYENEAATNEAFDNQFKYSMPFSVKLIDFHIDEYPAKLGIYDINTGKSIDETGKHIFEAVEKNKTQLLDWEFEIVKVLQTSIKDSTGNYKFSDKFGAAPAALVKIIEKTTGKTTETWVSCGSFNVDFNPVILNQKYGLGMFNPEPKRFASKVEITYKDKSEIVELEVNKPYKVAGWKIYQLGYDEDLGRWSNLSTIEIVKDPWLPIVYLGIALLLAGSVYLFWIGKKTKNEEYKINNE